MRQETIIARCSCGFKVTVSNITTMNWHARYDGLCCWVECVDIILTTEIKNDLQAQTKKAHLR